jgi:hypothetical protein
MADNEHTVGGYTSGAPWPSLINSFGNELVTAQEGVYWAWVNPYNWVWKTSFDSPDAGIPYGTVIAGPVYSGKDPVDYSTGEFFPNYPQMEAIARPFVKVLAQKYSAGSSKFDGLPKEPDYESAPPPKEDKEKKKDDKLDLKFPDFKGPDFKGPKNGSPNFNGPKNGPPNFTPSNFKPPGSDLKNLGNKLPNGFDLDGDGKPDLDLNGNLLGKKLPNGFDLDGDGKPDLDLNGNPLGKKLPNGFDLDGDGKPDLDLNGNPLPNNTNLNRFNPPNFKPPGFDRKGPNDLNLKSPFIPPGSGLNNRLPKFGGPNGPGLNNLSGPGFSRGINSPGNNLLGGPPGGNRVGAPGIGSPLGAGNLLGRPGVGGPGAYPPGMHPQGAGQKENKEWERQTWLMEDDEVWADDEAALGVLGRTVDDDEEEE